MILRKVLDVANHPVIKARAHRQQDIAVLHGVVGFDRAVHAQHAQVFGIAGRISAQPHQREAARRAQHIHDGAQFVAGIAQNDAAARIHIGALGVLQNLQGFFDLTGVTFFSRVVGAHGDLLRVARPGGLLERNVFGQIHHDRPGAAAARNMKGALHDGCDVLR